MPHTTRQLPRRDEDLLSLRLCELPIKLTAPPLRRGANQLLKQLRAKNLRFRPHFWLSDGWFTPDDTGGIAIPFYLAHPRLRRLEQSQMLDIEGGSPRSFLQLLRHETGHAIDNVYQLHKRRDYKNVFGNYHSRYPDTYRPRPHSKEFVTHLDMWYAQSHPAEDFAETFAVWLDPRSNWRHTYANWPALRKLECVDAIMRDIAHRKPIITSRETYKPLHKLDLTLSEHYAKKRTLYLRDHPRMASRDLRRIFSDVARRPSAESARFRTAAAFIESRRRRLRETITRWTGESPLSIDAALVDIQTAAHRLRLHLRRPAEETEQDLVAAIAVQTLKYLNAPRHRIVV